MGIMRKKNSGPAISKAIIHRSKPEHVTIDPVLEQKLFDAYKAVTVEGQSIRQAAKRYGTSRTTLTKYLYGERKNKVVAHEYEMSLNVRYEDELESYIMHLTQCSDYINKRAVFQLANELLEMSCMDTVTQVKRSSIVSSEKRRKVSQSWISKFFKRHPQLNNVKPVVFQKPRANDMYMEMLRQWYSRFAAYVDEHKVEAGQIYNVTESCYQLETQSGSCKVTYDAFKEAGEGRKCAGGASDILVVETICADGSKLDSLFVFHGQILEQLLNQSTRVNNQALFEMYTNSNQNVINDTSCYTYAELSFRWLRRFDLLTRSSSRKPRILLCSYNTCHVTLRFLKYCIGHDIVPLFLPFYLTTSVQPLASHLGPLLAHLLKNRLSGRIPDVSDFLRSYTDCRSRVFLEISIRDAFRKSGIVPVCPDSVLAGWNGHTSHKEWEYIDLTSNIAMPRCESVSSVEDASKQPYEDDDQSTDATSCSTASLQPDFQQDFQHFLQQGIHDDDRKYVSYWKKSMMDVITHIDEEPINNASFEFKYPVKSPENDAENPLFDFDVTSLINFKNSQTSLVKTEPLDSDPLLNPVLEQEIMESFMIRPELLNQIAF